MSLISLINGQGSAVVDAADLPVVADIRWRIDSSGRYAVASGRAHKNMQMHRLLLGFPKEHVDHIDGNGLNNRRVNLRSATPEQNNWNRRSRPNSSSRFKCVTWHKSVGKWQVCFRVSGKQHYLGLFQDEIEAARAYDDAIRTLHGEFAVLNFPEVV